MENIERQQAENFQFLRNAWQEGIDSGDAGAPHIPLAVANWEFPSRSWKGDR